MNRLMNAALLAATALTLSLLPGLSATAAAAESGTVEPGSMSTADRQQAEANTAEEQQRKKEAAEEARREAEKLAEEQRRERASRCQIRPVMTDAEIATCKEVWR